jgi:hypothetical protein
MKIFILNFLNTKNLQRIDLKKLTTVIISEMNDFHRRLNNFISFPIISAGKQMFIIDNVQKLEFDFV